MSEGDVVAQARAAMDAVFAQLDGERRALKLAAGQVVAMRDAQITERAALTEREAAVLRRENALAAVRQELAAARAGRQAAIDDAAKLDEKLRAARNELGALRAENTKLRAAFGVVHATARAL